MASDGPPVPDLPDFIARRLPFDRRCVSLEKGSNRGLMLHTIDHGGRNDPAVLLAHGNPTWSFLWRKVISHLEGFRCVAPDLLGLGLSDRFSSPREHSLARHADALAELVEQLGLTRVILVGQDWGGPIVTAVGARLPDRVAGIVLGNTSVLAPQRPRGTAFHRFANFPIVSDLVFRFLGFPLRSLHRVQGEPTSIRGDIARAYRWPLSGLKDRASPLALARMVPNSIDHPSYGELQKTEAWLRSFEGPMALVWGRKDPILGRALKRHTKAFPKASVTVTDGGHFLQEQVPEEMASAIQQVATGNAGHTPN
ncbi:MAG: alpha/beta fold hydrolase [Deltaproteobacteria bacterium]|nr:alpha/beta fold hydrolase [Deltaproteobacteria bacterium]